NLCRGVARATIQNQRCKAAGAIPSLRVYADSSFILRLVTIEAGSDAAMTEHRRLDHPRLFFSPIHALEVRNAILQRAFHERRSVSGGDRRNVTRQRDAALERLERFLK